MIVNMRSQCHVKPIGCFAAGTSASRQLRTFGMREQSVDMLNRRSRRLTRLAA